MLPRGAQVGGFAARIYMVNVPRMNAYIAMSVLLVVSPTLLALTDYVLVQKVMLVGAWRAELAAPP